MARLIVRDIVVSGFIRYSEDAPGTLTLNGRGPVAIVGTNGVGKSSIASKALSWCLYGKCSPERMGASTRTLAGKDVVAEGCKTATVTTTLIDEDDGSGYIIERYRTRSKADSVAVVRIEADGTRAPLKAATQATIDQIMGCGHEVFCATVLRGQGDPWNFAEATDAKKREILAAVSGADHLSESFKAARDLGNTLERETQALTQRAQDAVQRAERIDIDGMRRQEAAWAGEQAARIAQAEAEVKALEASEVIARQNDDIARTQQGALADHARSRPVAPAKPTLDRAPYDAAVQAHHAAQAAAIAEHSTCAAAWKAVEHLGTGDECPTCGQTIAATAPVADKRAVARPALEGAEQRLSAAQGGYAAAVKARQDAEAWLNAEVAKWETAKAAAVSDWEAKRPNAVSGGNLPAAQAATAVARRRLADLRMGDNPHTAVLARAIEDKADLLREAAQYELAAALKSRDCRLVRVHAEALSPKGVPAFLADDVLATIEVNANRWLEVLSAGTLIVEFRVSSGERIDTVVTTTDTPAGGSTERSLLQYSGGERARVNIAVDLGVAAAFSANDGLPLSLLVLDEGVFSGVDNAGKAAIVQALLMAGVRDVVVIDHDPAARGRLDREVLVSRGIGGYATIEEVAA